MCAGVRSRLDMTGRERTSADVSETNRRLGIEFRRIFAISLLLVGLTTAVIADHVTVDYDHAAKFNQMKTYPWSNVHTANSIWDQRVKDAIDTQLAAKGCCKIDDNKSVEIDRSRRLLGSLVIPLESV
jgi:uncharacterized protein DUF4136